MAVLDDQFLKELASLAAPYPRYKWYLSAMVALGAMNYPEEIPNLYTRLLASYIPKEEQFSETRKIREAFTKLCGIQGAAKVECHCFSFHFKFTVEKELTKKKTGSALRNLYNATPKDLLDPTRYRKNDTDEIAFARGEEFHKRIYGPNPSYEDNANNLAAPDYHYIVRSKYACQSGFYVIFNLTIQTISTDGSSHTMGLSMIWRPRKS